MKTICFSLFYRRDLTKLEEKELEKLQRYIYKRNQDQTTDEVIAHILKMDKKYHLTAAEWDQLLTPTISCMDEALFQWLLEKGAAASPEVQIASAKWVVSSQEGRLIYQQKRVSILKILIATIQEPEVLNQALGESLVEACWYNNLYVVEYLVAAGGNLFFQNDAGKTPYQLAKIYGQRFGDYTLFCMLIKAIAKGEKISGTENFFKGKDHFGNQIYVASAE